MPHGRIRALDRFLGGFLVLGSLLHAGGSWAGYRGQPETLVWALSGSLAGLLLASLHLLRVDRPDDRAIGWISFAGSVAWMGVALGFGYAVGNVLDPRGLTHALNAALLAAMSVRTLAGSEGQRAHG